MSSSDAQPPLSRRQARERERAANGGAQQPATPPPTVAVPASSSDADTSRRRPGSHVAPAAPAPAQSSVPPLPPASATEIVPGTGGLTRRQIRLMREAQDQSVTPVPLQNPTPQSSDRTVQDVLGTVSAIESDERPTEPDVEPAVDRAAVEPALDPAAVEQATSADGSPDAIEPLEEAAAHSEEPRRHRSTWAPYDAEPESSAAAPAPERPAVAPPIPPSTPGVFPLSLDDELDDDTNEVPLPQASRDADGLSAPEPEDQQQQIPAAFQRRTEPKPLTTAFEPPAGHWSQQAHDSNDAEIHDDETGTRRIAVANTNAIILPNSALADPTGALNATGEVILTGSIDLPASLSSTGSHRPIDGAEVDRLLEQHDEQPDTDASPVRASRAVSSHTSTRQVVLAAAKPKESKTPVVLAVTASAVGVAAAAVIIVALVVTNFFGS